MTKLIKPDVTISRCVATVNLCAHCWMALDANWSVDGKHYDTDTNSDLLCGDITMVIDLMVDNQTIRRSSKSRMTGWCCDALADFYFNELPNA